jgi:hypothetical protein
MRCKRYLLLSLPIIWYYISIHDKETIKVNMHYRGLLFSQKFKKYPAFDKYLEPMIINQFAILFTAGNAFIHGMLADNKDQIEVKHELENFNKQISEELSTKLTNKE